MRSRVALMQANKLDLKKKTINGIVYVSFLFQLAPAAEHCNPYRPKSVRLV